MLHICIKGLHVSFSVINFHGSHSFNMIPIDGCVISWALHRNLLSDISPEMLDQGTLKNSLKKWRDCEWSMFQCSLAGGLFLDAAEEIDRVGTGRKILVKEWRHLVLYVKANLSKEQYEQLICELYPLTQSMC